MSCDCGCNSCSDSFSGLMGLMGALLPAGSAVRVGFNYGTPYFSDESSADTLIAEVEQALYSSGGFDLVNIAINQSYTGNNYMTVSGITSFDFSDKEDVGGFIQQQVQGWLPSVTFYSRDAVQIDPVISSPANTTGSQQRRDNPQKPATGIFDQLAGWLHVSTSEAVAIGAIAALGGFLLITKMK